MGQNRLRLLYCPRVKSGTLKKPLRRCKWKGENFPGLRDDIPEECCYWTKKGLLKYCEDNGTPIQFSLRAVCVLEIPPLEAPHTRNHVKSFTYAPKIRAVLNGTCTQTMRPAGKQPVQKGDSILFHGWEGRPYRSNWSWRLRVTVTDVQLVTVSLMGIRWHDSDTFIPWEQLDWLAKLDHIIPATGLALRDVLKSMHGTNALKDRIETQIITWEP